MGAEGEGKQKKPLKKQGDIKRREGWGGGGGAGRQADGAEKPE